MKKILLLALVAIATTTYAQRNVYLSTSGNAINFSSIRQQTQQIKLSRILMAGYNTICLPFSLSEEELQKAVGEGVRLERLVKAEGNILYFLDVTSEGIVAGTPYLIYSPTQKVASFTTMQKEMAEPRTLAIDGVKMYSSFQKETPTGVYGIPALQNTEILQSILVRVDGEKCFLPTRCAISTEAETPEIRHIASLDEATGLAQVIAADEVIDVYTIGGALVKAGISAAKAKKSLPKGVYVVKGQKFLVK